MSKLVAMTVENKNGLRSLLDPRFGRAPAFLIVDLDSRDIIAELDNASADLAHGAGTGSAATMSAHDVQVVISGRFGPRAEQALNQLGIEMRIAPADIAAGQALDLLAAGTLEKPPTDAATETGRGGGMGRGGGRGIGRGGGMGRGGGRGMGGGGGMRGGGGRGRSGGGGMGRGGQGGSR